MENLPETDPLTRSEAYFIDSRDSFYVATVSETGWPTCNTARSTRIQRSTFNVQRSTFNVQRSAFSVQRSTFNVQRSAFGVRRSAFNVRRSAEHGRSQDIGNTSGSGHR